MILLLKVSGPVAAGGKPSNDDACTTQTGTTRPSLSQIKESICSSRSSVCADFQSFTNTKTQGQDHGLTTVFSIVRGVLRFFFLLLAAAVLGATYALASGSVLRMR